ncbi:MAG: alpha/beta hydrolase, partial [Hyphomicrobiales bacterium]|nr:alpha/beta hydrolase [Hyphomicrobiales bacterium]
MAKIELPDEVEINRRHLFCGGAAAALAATQLGYAASAKAQGAKAKSVKFAAIKSASNISFAPLKQIDAGLLNVGYVETGPDDGKPVLLLHGWPYDIQSYVEVAP